jgi:hypothetical protein
MNPAPLLHHYFPI